MPRLCDLRACTAAGGRAATEGLSEERAFDSLMRLLAENVLCAMATVTNSSLAHTNIAYYSYSRTLELFFLSHPGSLHCRNLSTNISMAIAVFSTSQEWSGPDRGVQLFGTCQEARGKTAQEARRLYEARFPHFESWVADLPADDPASAYRFYRFSTDAFTLLDEAAFGDAVFVKAAVERTTIADGAG